MLTAGLREETESLIYDHYGDTVSVIFNKISIPIEIKSIAEKNAHLRFTLNQIYIWEILDGDSLIGIVFLDNVKGKSQPITYAVFFDSDGKVQQSHIIKYREPIGGEVSNRQWLKQFIGKSNPFKETMSPFDGGLKEGEGICFSSVLGYWIGLRLKTQ